MQPVLRSQSLIRGPNRYAIRRGVPLLPPSLWQSRAAASARDRRVSASEWPAMGREGRVAFRARDPFSLVPPSRGPCLIDNIRNIEMFMKS